MRAPPNRCCILLGRKLQRSVRQRTKRRLCKVVSACESHRYDRCHSHRSRRRPFLRAPPRRHRILLGRQRGRTARQRNRRRFFGACAGHRHNRCNSNRRRRQAFLRTTPRRHHILLGRQLGWPAGQRAERKKCKVACTCAGHRFRRVSHYSEPMPFYPTHKTTKGIK